MTKKVKGSKAEIKQSNGKSESSNANAEKTVKQTASNSGASSSKSDAPKSASQSSISHFSSVSTPEYRAGWDKIFGKSKENTPTAAQPSQYEQRRAFVAEQWGIYQKTKNPKHLASICRELPFFEHPEVGKEIATLLTKK